MQFLAPKAPGFNSCRQLCISNDSGTRTRAVNCRCAFNLVSSPPFPSRLDAMAGLPASLRFGSSPPKPSAASRPPGGGATGSPASAGGKARAQPLQVGVLGSVTGPLASLQLLTAAPLLLFLQTSEAAWQAECERVASKLVITAPADGGGAWRPQLDRGLASLASLQAAAPVAMAAIEGAGQELSSSTEALAAAEEAADAELADLRAEHKAAVAAVAVLQQEQAARQEYVASLEQELQFLNKVPSAACTPLLAGLFAGWCYLVLLDAGGCWWVLAMHGVDTGAGPRKALGSRVAVGGKPLPRLDDGAASCAGAGGAAAGGGGAGGQHERQPPSGAPGAGVRRPAGGAAGHGCAYGRAPAPAAADHGQEQRLSRLEVRLWGLAVHQGKRIARLSDAPVAAGQDLSRRPQIPPHVPPCPLSACTQPVLRDLLTAARSSKQGYSCCEMRRSDQRPLPARPSANRRRLRRRAAQTNNWVCACVGVPWAAVEAGVQVKIVKVGRPIVLFIWGLPQGWGRGCAATLRVVLGRRRVCR